MNSCAVEVTHQRTMPVLYTEKYRFKVTSCGSVVSNDDLFNLFLFSFFTEMC